MKRPGLIAVDLGAESCRVSLLRWAGADPQIQLVHRFANGPIQHGKRLTWDIERIIQGVIDGLCRCAAIAEEGIASVGVDGWAVDYVRLGQDSRPVADPRCYRDERTITAEAEVQKLVSREELYRLTGIQFLRFNTIYQLYADQQEGIDRHARWVNLPEYVLYRLGGHRAAEYTNSTHTQLIDLRTSQWCQPIFDRVGLDVQAAPHIVETGTILGQLTGALAELPAFQSTQLIAPACHDTASAIAGIPAEGEDWAFISSGTWSLVGTTLEAPCATNAALTRNFTNLGGVGKRICFLKNVNGMWLLQQCLESWKEQGHTWTIPELVQRCAGARPPAAYLDVDDPDLLLPGDMPGRIRAQLERRQIARVAADGASAIEAANLIFHSLAKRYAEVLQDINSITGKPIKKLYIVGGGSRNSLLNRLTAEQTGLQVVPGAAESSTIGNFAVQLARLDGDWKVSVGVSAEAVAAWARALIVSALPQVKEASAEVVA
ncbi:MAG TPA: FGGY-family carbohydrate kinase [Terriglobales bacterium]|nr:FGGY-family carbohydrate kinase [Terriglobales bacterium]